MTLTVPMKPVDLDICADINLCYVDERTNQLVLMKNCSITEWEDRFVQEEPVKKKKGSQSKSVSHMPTSFVEFQELMEESKGKAASGSRRWQDMTQEQQGMLLLSLEKQVATLQQQMAQVMIAVKKQEVAPARWKTPARKAPKPKEQTSPSEVTRSVKRVVEELGDILLEKPDQTVPTPSAQEEKEETPVPQAQEEENEKNDQESSTEGDSKKTE